MRTLPLALALPLLLPLAPARADDPNTGGPCRLVADLTETRSDVASYYLVGGPWVVAAPGVTSVTMTCTVTVDGHVAVSTGRTTPGAVGYHYGGHVTVGTFSGPTIAVCTRVTWTGGTGGSYDDCAS